MIYPLNQLKPKPKTKKNFAGVNENSTIFLYTLDRRVKKVFFFKVYNKVEMLLTKKNLVSIFIFEFQLIQWIDHRRHFL